jgi:hypothetical protein
LKQQSVEHKPNETMAVAMEGATAIDGITATVTVTALMIGATATVMGRAAECIGGGDGRCTESRQQQW